MTTDPLADLDAARGAISSLLADQRAQITADEKTIAASNALVLALQEKLASVPAPRKLLFGAYVSGMSAASMVTFDAVSGVKVPLARYYLNLGTGGLVDAPALAAAGRTLILSFTAKDGPGATNWRWTDIATAKYDTAITKVGKLLLALQGQHYVVFNHEPETTYRSGAQGQPNTYPATQAATDFAAAFDHVANTWKQMGVTHFITPCFQGSLRAPWHLPTVYDRVGFDPYNWANTARNGTFTWPETLVQHAIASCPDTETPVLLCETACAVDTPYGRKPEWLARLYLAARAEPRVEAVSYFSTNHSTTNEAADWRVDSDVQSIEVWQSVLKAAAA